jgi:hemin uptake protein HemP
MPADDADAVRVPCDGALERAQSGATAVAGSIRMVDSDSLLSREGALAIRHRGAIYYLRKTRFGKLILTK